MYFVACALYSYSVLSAEILNFNQKSLGTSLTLNLNNDEYNLQKYAIAFHIWKCIPHMVVQFT